ncbi:multivesicular body subunit 12B-like isoform X1 [Tachysurus ichikawai]
MQCSFIALPPFSLTLKQTRVATVIHFARQPRQSHLGNVLVDMKLIDIKDTLPVGFIPIQETVDTQEPAFRKRRLCIKFIPRDSTEAAICDIRILGRSKQAPPQYTFIGAGMLLQQFTFKEGLSQLYHHKTDLPQTLAEIAQAEDRHNTVKRGK